MFTCLLKDRIKGTDWHPHGEGAQNLIGTRYVCVCVCVRACACVISMLSLSSSTYSPTWQRTKPLFFGDFPGPSSHWHDGLLLPFPALLSTQGNGEQG